MIKTGNVKVVKYPSSLPLFVYKLEDIENFWKPSKEELTNKLVEIKTKNNIQITFYVSINGNDTTGNGSYANPFRTIKKASTTNAGTPKIIVVKNISGNFSEEIDTDLASLNVYIFGGKWDSTLTCVDNTEVTLMPSNFFNYGIRYAFGCDLSFYFRLGNNATINAERCKVSISSEDGRHYPSANFEECFISFSEVAIG